MTNGSEEVKNGVSNNKISPYKWLLTSVNLLRNLGVLETSEDVAVVEFSHPAALQKKLDLTLDKPLEDDDEIIKICEDIIKSSVFTNHPHFHNQLYGGTDPYGLVGALLTEALNTNQYTFEVAPSFTLCEHVLINHIFQKFKYGDGDGIFVPVAPAFTLIEQKLLHKVSSLMGFLDGDGIFSPGGSLSNMYAMVLARHKLKPEIKKKGLYCLDTLVAFTSEDSHYSVLKGINWIGIGTENLVKVKTDDRGKMIVEDLEKMILKVKQEGRVPFFVNATAGTTVLGSFDPLLSIADVCQKYKLWLHVDACWGGSLIFSKKYSKALEGIDRADSFAWNAHKMLGAPLQCSVFITKHKDLLHQCNCASASYLFQQDKFYDVNYDTGDKSIQCGRKVDAFKLWLMWKARGDSGFEKVVDQAMACSRYFKNEISNRLGFRLILSEFECTNVCFWYIPKRLRNLEETEDWWEKIGKITSEIKEKLTYAGTLMIGYQPLLHKNLKNFFRLVNTCHPERSFNDMDHVIRQIEFYGENL